MSEIIHRHYHAAAKIATKRLIKMFYCTGFTAAILIVGTQALKISRSYQSLGDWFDVYEFHVPSPQVSDAETPGEPDNAKPYLFFGRHIKKYFDVDYSVNITRVDHGDTGVCNNSGTHSYRPRDDSTLQVWSFDHFLGTHCQLDPGKYRFEITWKVLRDGFFPVHAAFQSDVFEIIKK